MMMEQKDLSIKLREADDRAAVISLSGFLNAETADHLAVFVDELRSTHEGRLIICDFQKVEFMSSAGIGVFRRMSESHGIQFAFVNLNSVARRPLEVLGFLSFFGNYSSIASARSHRAKASGF